MANFQYYCEVKCSTPELLCGTYVFAKDTEAKFSALNFRLIQHSERVWRQGPRGGIKIIKDRASIGRWPVGYVSSSEEHAKEFMWVKLKAKEVK